MGEHETPEAGFTLLIQDGGDKIWSVLPYSYRTTLPHMVGENLVALFVTDRLLCVTHYVHIQHRAAATRLPFFLISLGDKYE